jgi:hypothetical protein
MRALLGLGVLFLTAPALADAPLEDRLSKIEDDLAETQAQVKQLLPLTGRLSGYLDFGFFRVSGNGSGIRPDLGNVVFPEYKGVVPGSWVFMGDPLATAINSRGEPADTDGSRAVTFDPVHDGGVSSFIVNALNLNLFAGIGSDLVVQALIDFVPRGRDVSNPDGLFLGDYLDVKLAYVEWRAPFERWKLSLFAGKFDSTLGYEYRVEEASDRISVTPSLICRYTCGRPLGLKARARFFDEALVINLAVTNGSNFWEGFPFYDEIDTNDVKTVSGRLSYRFPLGSGLEIGASGAIGAQDLQTDNSVLQWHVGADLHLDWNDIDFAAEVVKGKAEGKTDAAGPACDVAPCLDYQGAYGLVGWRATNWFMPYARVDWRDALHRSGASFVYVSKLMRATAGVHFELGSAVIIKAEYTLVHELAPLPDFDDDVLTSSLVVKY